MSSNHHKPELSDVELVLACQGGDRSAFDELVKRHQGKVYAMIRNMVKNETDAWDLSQDAFIKAWSALPKFEARAKFSTWMFRIAHNTVYDWMRKRKIESAGEINDDLLGGSAIDFAAPTSPKKALRPDQSMQNEELGKRIEGALETLSPEHREVVLLKEVQGLAYKEIAEAVGCSIGTVMSRLFYARKKLQEELADEKPR